MRRWALAAIAVPLGALLGVGQVWQHLQKPFDLDEFLARCERGGHFVPPTPEFLELLSELQGAPLTKAAVTLKRPIFNERGPKDYLHLSRRAFLVDAPAFLDSLFVPIAEKDFVRTHLLGGGVAYSCQQLFIVDASDPARLGHIYVHEQIHSLSPLLDLTPQAREAVDSSMRSAAEALDAQQWQEAMGHYERALATCPSLRDALDNLAYCQKRLGNTERAIALYRQSLRHTPLNPIGRRNLIIALVERGELAEAEAELAVFRAQDPKDAEGAFWAGVVELKHRHLEPAARLFSEAADLYRAAGSVIALEVDAILVGMAALTGHTELHRSIARLELDCEGLGPSSALSTTYCVKPEAATALGLRLLADYRGPTSASAK